LPEASWEVTTRHLWAVLLSATVLGLCLALALATVGIASLAGPRTSEGAAAASALLVVLAMVFAGAQLGAASRYPSVDDHDEQLAASSKLMRIRALLSFLFAGLFLGVTAPFWLNLLNWMGGLAPSVLASVFWFAWAGALAASAGGQSRATSVVAGVAVAVIMLFPSLLLSHHVFLITFVGVAALLALAAIVFARFRGHPFKSQTPI